MNLNTQIPKLCAPVTPSDTTRFAATALLIANGGTLVVFPEGDSANPVTLTVPAGYFLCRVVGVGVATTCTGITRFWS